MDLSAVPLTVVAPMQATVVSIDGRAGEVVRSGQQLVVLESMKMQHVVAAETSGGAETVVLSYDYTVRAGTQDLQGHCKKDRLFEVAERLRLPVVVFTEGGGGRPGDIDVAGVSYLDVMAFHLFARLSGLVPLVGIASGRCFAGNAALLGCCDVVIATADANIGMGGPAMIEGGGLGVHSPDEVG